MTRQLLWMEYKAQAGVLAMGYSHFCHCYREWKKNAPPPRAPGTPRWRKAIYRLLWSTIPVITPDTVNARIYNRGTEDCRNAIDATVLGGSFTKSPEKGWQKPDKPPPGVFLHNTSGFGKKPDLPTPSPCPASSRFPADTCRAPRHTRLTESRQ